MNQQLTMEELLRLLQGQGSESKDSAPLHPQEMPQDYNNEQLMTLLGFYKPPIRSDSKSTIGIRG